MKSNQSGGIFCGCPEKPVNLVQDAYYFLKKFPMSIKMINCEVTQNMHYGVLVQDFWKGSVIIERSLVQHNCNFGIYIHAKEPPKESAAYHKQLEPSFKNVMLSLDKGHNEDLSAALFKQLAPAQHRRGTLPITGSSQTHPFNVSGNSQGAGQVATKPVFARRKTMNNLLSSMQKVPSLRTLKVGTLSPNRNNKQANAALHNNTNSTYEKNQSTSQVLNPQRAKPQVVHEKLDTVGSSSVTPATKSLRVQDTPQNARKLASRADDNERG